MKQTPNSKIIRGVLPTLAACGALALGLSACGGSSSSSSSDASAAAKAGGTINGAGSTFAAPVYQQWGSELKARGITVNYQGVGSGAGVAGLAQGTAEFAGSDPALTADDRAALKKGDVLQIPMFFGAITLAYNVPGLETGLKLDGPTAAAIFLGKVKSWDDPAIAKLNHGVKLPSGAITVVHRSDESGTTKGFTTFLAEQSPEWKSRVGADKTVKWPTGTGAKGNDGVAAAIKQTSGSIGYVEQAYALQNGFATASVKNSAGNFVAADLESTSAAGEGLTVPADLGINTINSPGPHAYPITSQTFLDAYKDPCKALGMKKGDAQALAEFISYGLGKGQDVLGELKYARLPDSLKAKSEAALKSMTCNGTALTPAA